jgi:hypothetical protein
MTMLALNRLLTTFSLAGAALLLGGCAAFNNLNNEVSTYGEWPSGRKAATYAFDRLPSQAAQPQREQMLEDAARGAIEIAGFTPAADVASADYLMQLGARVSLNDPWYYDDPLWWRGGARWHRGYGRYGPRYVGGFWGPGWGPGWGAYETSASFEREVAVLIRDRRTGQILYEARASNVGPSSGIDYLLPAMFEAALKDFPSGGPNPRKVTTQISKTQASAK